MCKHEHPGFHVIPHMPFFRGYELPHRREIVSEAGVSREAELQGVELSPRGVSCEPNHRFYGPVMEGWEAVLESCSCWA